jgi:hypothetical protein
MCTCVVGVDLVWWKHLHWRVSIWMLFGYYSDTLYRWYLTLLAGDGIAVGGTRVTLILHAWPDGPKRSASGRGMFW